MECMTRVNMLYGEVFGEDKIGRICIAKRTGSDENCLGQSREAHE